MKLFRIIDKHGRVVRSREKNGYYDTKISAIRATKQLAYRYVVGAEFTIEETEVNWVVSDR